MKIDKELQKQCERKIKEIAIEHGYKKVQNTFYKKQDDNFISVSFVIVDSCYLVYVIQIKKHSWDSIFWEILDMEENIKKGDSLRAIGAFSAPAILVSKKKVELDENIEAVAHDFIDTISQEIDSFLMETTVMEYIFSDKATGDVEILQCLGYLETRNVELAIEIARNQIIKGDTGRFVNNGKGFYELVLQHYS